MFSLVSLIDCCVLSCYGNSPTAVLLESFSLFYNEDDSCLDHAIIKDFVLMWSKFDQKASVSHLTTAFVATIYLGKNSSGKNQAVYALLKTR